VSYTRRDAAVQCDLARHAAAAEDSANMNRAIVFALLAGVGAGLLTVFVVPAVAEIAVGLALIAVLTIHVVRTSPVPRFGRAFTLGIIAGAAVTTTHLLFLSRYAEGRANELEAMREWGGDAPVWVTLLLFAPIYWLALGAIVGGVVGWWQRQRDGA
jgi:hypothetical protein